MISIVIVSILSIIGKFPTISGIALPDHRRDGPIPYPIRINSEPAPLRLDSGPPITGTINDAPNLNFLQQFISSQFNNNQLPAGDHTFRFPTVDEDSPQDQPPFIFSNRDAAVENDRQMHQDYIISAMQTPKTNPLQVVSLVPTKGDSPEARFDDTGAPVFTVLAHPNRQPDTLRDYAFLEDTEDHLKSPIPTTTPTSITNFKPITVTTPASTIKKTTSTKPTTSASTRPTLATSVSKPSTSTSNPFKPSSTSRNKATSSNRRNITTSNSTNSELRMIQNNDVDKHHDIKRSPQQELPYTPSFRRRNANTSSGKNNLNLNTGNFGSSNSGHLNSPIPNQGFGGYNNPTTIPNNGYSATYNGFTNQNPSTNSGYNNYNLNTASFLNRLNYNNQPLNNPSYTNLNNAGYNPNFQNNAGYNPNFQSNAGYNPNFQNNAGYNSPALSNGPNNYYNLNQHVPQVVPGIPANSHIPLTNSYSLNPNYNLLALVTPIAPQLPISYRSQQPVTFNAVPSVPTVPSVSYPVHVAPIHSIPTNVLPTPNFLASPPAYSLNMVNPPAAIPTAGIFATPPIISAAGVSPLVGLYSQPLLSTLPSQMIITQNPYGEPAPQQVPPPTPVFRNPLYPPIMYNEPQRPIKEEPWYNHDNDIDDDDDDDRDNNDVPLNNQPYPNLFPPIYFPNTGYDQPPYSANSPDNDDRPQQSPSKPKSNRGKSHTNSDNDNDDSPGLVSDSFPDFQPNVYSSSSSGEPSFDADFINRPKSSSRNRGKTRNRNTEETTSYRPTDKIPRVEPVEGRTISIVNSGLKQLPKEGNLKDSATTTTEKPILTTQIPTTSPPLVSVTPNKSIFIHTDDDEHVNITITEPTPLPQTAEDRAYNPYNNQQMLKYNRFANPEYRQQMSTGQYVGFSINDPRIKQFLKEIIRPIELPPNAKVTEKVKTAKRGQSQRCIDLFGRNIPNCKILRTKSRSLASSDRRRKSKKSKSRPKVKSFNPQLFDIIEGGSFAEPELPETTDNFPHIRPPPDTVPISKIEHMLHGIGTQQTRNTFNNRPLIRPIRFHSLPQFQPPQQFRSQEQFKQFQSPPQQSESWRPITYDRRSRLISPGHPGLYRSRFA